MKNRVVLILILLTLVTGNGLAQDQDGTVLHANRAEISLLDRLAAGRDLLIKPSRIIEYWPEYRYSYSVVVGKFNESPMNGESPCDIASRDADTGNFILGTIAVFQDGSDNLEGSTVNDEQSYFGWPIVTEDNLGTSGNVPWSVNDNSWSLDFRDFCEGLRAIENAVNKGYNLQDLVNTNIGGVDGINIDATALDHFSEASPQSETDRPNIYFVTSQALPYQNLEFERVRIQPLPQNQWTN